MMQDRPGNYTPCVLVSSENPSSAYRSLSLSFTDLIQSELAGLAFDSLQQVFRKVDIEFAFGTPPLECELDTTVWIVVDPAAGGPSSDFAVLSMCRQRGCVTVSRITRLYSSPRTPPQSARACTSRP